LKNKGEDKVKRLRIVIKGKVVQDIGFRLFLYERADEMGIPEFQARNIKEGVEVLVCGEDFTVNNFMDLLRKERPKRVEVEAIEVEAYEGQIKPIERFPQSFMLTQLGKFVDIGVEMLATEKEIKRDTGMMLEKQDIMLEKQDIMLEKQDTTIGAIRELAEKIDKGKEDIVSEIRTLREDLKS
jgi:acylphosphatase